MEYKKVPHPIHKNAKINFIIMKKIAFILTVVLLSASRFAEVKEIRITGKVTDINDRSAIFGCKRSRNRNQKRNNNRCQWRIFYFGKK